MLLVSNCVETMKMKKTIHGQQRVNCENRKSNVDKDTAMVYKSYSTAQTVKTH